MCRNGIGKFTQVKVNCCSMRFGRPATKNGCAATSDLTTYGIIKSHRFRFRGINSRASRYGHFWADSAVTPFNIEV